MSAIRKIVNVNFVNVNFVNVNFVNVNFVKSIATNLSNKSALPLPIPIELVLKPYVEELQELIQIPPPYCPVCNSFLTNPSCNKRIQPKSCPLNSK